MGLLGHEELRLDIDSKDPVDLVFLDIFKIAKVLDARVAHDDVDMPEFGHRLAEQAGDLVALANISSDAECPHAFLSRSRRDGFGGGFRGDVVDDDVCPERRKLERDGCTDAAA